MRMKEQVEARPKRVELLLRFVESVGHTPAGGTWVFFGWVCAARDSKLAPRSKKISPKIDTPF